ncbi:MAG: PilZ domain-containing protein [Desulfobulbaceae bacterium]|nr:PilZ domain-containing protein [Desulfobulbaceae bacterium]
MDDRRKNQRVRLKDGCIIHHSEIVGTVRDISMGGMSCTCLDQRGSDRDISTRGNIYCNRLELVVEKISMKILESQILPGKFAAHLGVRKCRVLFHQLDDSQKDQLAHLIKHSFCS